MSQGARVFVDKGRHRQPQSYVDQLQVRMLEDGLAVLSGLVELDDFGLVHVVCRASCRQGRLELGESKVARLVARPGAAPVLSGAPALDLEDQLRRALLLAYARQNWSPAGCA